MAQRIRRFQQVSQLVTVVVLIVDAVLLATGTITTRQAATLFVAVEVPLIGAVALTLVIAIVAQRRFGDGLRDATAKVLGQSPLWMLVRAEVRTYRSLWLWIRRRHSGIEHGAIVFTSTRGTLVIPAAFAVATGIEIVVLHLLLPWVWLQVSLAVLSVWSLVMLFGYLAVHRTNPHYLTDTSLVLRQSGDIVTIIDRANIKSIVSQLRFAETAPSIRGGQLFLPNINGTTVDIALISPVIARLPALVPSRGKTGQVSYVSLYVDAPGQVLREIT
ncbi:hypothetical protein BFN03_18385 [Rhodococcus sp. WMMA185]|uniref:hypothetical protein n=1 Tax=Rhodococcus sp. WMMA185 TaxID=679318 RepID=UPI000878ED72|nr:hypothetical protein [Rhodococcus sp. WMMA185]AOW93962.1 hypothetical protein BFN03_18385 [Rhodococcus sp. WMMA185]